MNSLDYIKKVESDIRQLEKTKNKVKHYKKIRNLKIVGVVSLYLALTTGITVGCMEGTKAIFQIDKFVGGNVNTTLTERINYNSIGEYYSSTMEHTNSSDILSITLYSKEHDGYRNSVTINPESLDYELKEAVLNNDIEYVTNYVNNCVLTSIVTSTRDYDGCYIEITEYINDGSISICRKESTYDKIAKWLIFIVMFALADSVKNLLVCKNDYSHAFIWNKIRDMLDDCEDEFVDLGRIDILIDAKMEELSLFKEMR